MRRNMKSITRAQRASP